MTRRPRGELETAVLRILWDSPTPLAAKDIRDAFTDQDPVPALTTLLTVLDRLAKKGTVVKEPATGAGYVFSAASSESTFAATAMVSALLSSSDRSAALLRFAGQLDASDLQALRRAVGTDDTDEN